MAAAASVSISEGSSSAHRFVCGCVWIPPRYSIRSFSFFELIRRRMGRRKQSLMDVLLISGGTIAATRKEAPKPTTGTEGNQPRSRIDTRREIPGTPEYSQTHSLVKDGDRVRARGRRRRRTCSRLAHERKRGRTFLSWIVP